MPEPDSTHGQILLTAQENPPVYPDTSQKVSEPLPADTTVKQLTAADTTQALLYARQLKREAVRNFAIGAAEIAVGILSVFLLPYWLPILIVHVLLALVLFIIAIHKINKAKDVAQDPGKHPLPVKDNLATDSAIAPLSIIGYALLVLAVLAILLLVFAIVDPLWFLILLIVLFYVITLPLTAIALVLITIAAVKGRNRARKDNLLGVRPTATVTVFNAINWSIIGIAFTAIVISISERFKPK